MEIIVKSGPLIWPILIESVLALWVIIERSIFFISVLPRRRKALIELVAEITKEGGKVSDASVDELGGFAKAIRRGMEEGSLNQSLLSLQADGLVGEAEKFLSLLNIIAQTAPLLGLLGTVFGMIGAFIQIQNLGSQVTPADLAGGIWEALLTTAEGLTVAIPALIAYIGFGRAADRYAQQVDAAGSQVVHKLSKSGLEIV
jgi:biopolymer transport protein ExbB